MFPAPSRPSASCEARTRAFSLRSDPLPGRTPEDNPRVMTVAGRFDKLTLAAFLSRAHPHVACDDWRARAEAGSLCLEGQRVRDLNVTVRAGNRLIHTIPRETEPDVATAVRFLYEDPHIFVVHKPAPLPVHPCGRFRRNTLTALFAHAFSESVKPVHRLDADTAGLMVLARTRQAAHHLGRQFESRTVEKDYLALVEGLPPWDRLACTLPLSSAPQGAGKREVVPEGPDAGHDALTLFERLRPDVANARCLLRAKPSSGRTNQIRVHLAALGFPIVGDAAYAGTDAFTSGQFPLCLHAFKLAFRHPHTDAPLSFEDVAPPWAEGA
ncbi:MAG: RluA family pseudouridine synthase [Myxococcales bacterium]|nr:RluA family pseudouridine synthase [Myxococcales bacterium]